ncbi:MAG: polysaccharide deacetylase family protein [Methyloceanibacter sp.]|uniref:polysaccharide deacetylase family protein n=1 Tax=Methyloceanibacter sp. TaxID=1965321 RepID=UPI003D9AC13E
MISLDFELLWGVRDHSTRETYGANVLGGRAAIPAMLELFEKRGVHATWAVVGAVLCESKDELLARLPADGATGAAPLANLDEIGDDERHDPYHFGASLARLVASCPGQELGTHTFSHFCALEPGHSVGTFRDDVGAAVTQLKDWGIDCRSIVFPRNQYAPPQLDACRELGLTHFRGNEDSWFYAAAPGADQTKARRLCRLLDSYVDLSGPNVARRGDAVTPLVDVPASRFLRPYHRRLRGLDGLRLRRIETAMAAAAATGGTFHLWWHPENFGRDLDDNMSFLTKILDPYARLRDESGMASRTMSEMLALTKTERRLPA